MKKKLLNLELLIYYFTEKMNEKYIIKIEEILAFKNDILIKNYFVAFHNMLMQRKLLYLKDESHK